MACAVVETKSPIANITYSNLNDGYMAKLSQAWNKSALNLNKKWNNVFKPKSLLLDRRNELHLDNDTFSSEGHANASDANFAPGANSFSSACVQAVTSILDSTSTNPSAYGQLSPSLSQQSLGQFSALQPPHYYPAYFAAPYLSSPPYTITSYCADPKPQEQELTLADHLQPPGSPSPPLSPLLEQLLDIEKSLKDNQSPEHASTASFTSFLSRIDYPQQFFVLPPIPPYKPRQANSIPATPPTIPSEIEIPASEQQSVDMAVSTASPRHFAPSIQLASATKSRAKPKVREKAVLAPTLTFTPPPSTDPKRQTLPTKPTTTTTNTTTTTTPRSHGTRRRPSSATETLPPPLLKTPSSPSWQRQRRRSSSRVRFHAEPVSGMSRLPTSVEVWNMYDWELHVRSCDGRCGLRMRSIGATGGKGAATPAEPFCTAGAKLAKAVLALELKPGSHEDDFFAYDLVKIEDGGDDDGGDDDDDDDEDDDQGEDGKDKDIKHRNSHDSALLLDKQKKKAGRPRGSSRSSTKSLTRGQARGKRNVRFVKMRVEVPCCYKYSKWLIRYYDR